MNKNIKKLIGLAGIATVGACIAKVIMHQHGGKCSAMCCKCGHKFNPCSCPKCGHSIECFCPKCRRDKETEIGNEL